MFILMVVGAQLLFLYLFIYIDFTQRIIGWTII